MCELDDVAIKYGKELYSILLRDMTTKKNIIWATDEYTEYGDAYNPTKEIKLELFYNKGHKFIQTRNLKDMKSKSKRTKEKAEVFTPSWICNEQNNLVDNKWFGNDNVFNTSNSDNTWTTNLDKVDFSLTEGKTWKDYIISRRMEVSCGEAPYLTSRHDLISGDYILFENRIGLLDRKLRIVNENTCNEIEWFEWVVRAFQSIYGYEYQGDNVLLARINLLYTFIDCMKYKFNKTPTVKQLEEISEIIVWNIWQMDGTTYKVPLCTGFSGALQISLFEEENVKKKKAKYSVIKNWRLNKIIKFMSLLKENRDE